MVHQNQWVPIPIPEELGIYCFFRELVLEILKTTRSPGGIEAQCHAVFKNVRTVLEASGARWDQLLDVTVFLTDIDTDFQAYNKIYAEYFSDNAPCRTTVGVTSLPSPIDIEFKMHCLLGLIYRK